MDFFLSILKNLPDGAALGLVWGIMAIGVYITFKILDIPDMTVDGTFALGGCMIAATVSSGWNPFVSTALAVVCGMVAGLVTGVLHTKLKIPAILAGILTMLALYSINLMIMGGKSNIGMSQFGGQKVDTVLDHVSALFGMDAKTTNIVLGLILAVAIIALLYWFFGTEMGSLIRATGINEDMVRAQGGNRAGHCQRICSSFRGAGSADTEIRRCGYGNRNHSHRSGIHNNRRSTAGQKRFI